MCVCERDVCEWHVCVGGGVSLEVRIGSWILGSSELQMIMNHPKWVLGAELGSTARVEQVLLNWAVFAAFSGPSLPAYISIIEKNKLLSLFCSIYVQVLLLIFTNFP